MQNVWYIQVLVKLCYKGLKGITYLLIYQLNVLFTPLSRVLPEKITVSQLVKKFSAFYGTRRFTTTHTSARHLSLTWARSIQSMPPPHPISWGSILILSSHLRLGLPSGLLLKEAQNNLSSGKVWFGFIWLIVLRIDGFLWIRLWTSGLWKMGGIWLDVRCQLLSGVLNCQSCCYLWVLEKRVLRYCRAVLKEEGTAVAQWLGCCATNRKVLGSIPDGVTGIFHWHKILPIALWPWGRLSF